MGVAAEVIASVVELIDPDMFTGETHPSYLAGCPCALFATTSRQLLPGVQAVVESAREICFRFVGLTDWQPTGKYAVLVTLNQTRQIPERFSKILMLWF